MRNQWWSEPLLCVPVAGPFLWNSTLFALRSILCAFDSLPTVARNKSKRKTRRAAWTRRCIMSKVSEFFFGAASLPSSCSSAPVMAASGNRKTPMDRCLCCQLDRCKASQLEELATLCSRRLPVLWFNKLPLPYLWALVPAVNPP